MSLSLQEQLLKAGLVKPKQAKQVEQQQRLDRKRNVKPAVDPKAIANQAQNAKTLRDQELNRQQREKAERKARRAEIRQIVEQNRIPRIESEDFFNFVDGKKIHRFAVNPEVRERILSGALIVVRHNGFYALVPTAIAERIRERDATFIVAMDQAATESPAEDDPYKDHVVPDDLMW